MIADFYAPCLQRSMSYDRAVGYFRSTIFSLVNEDLISFARRGGKIRIVCSPFLSEADIKAMQEGYRAREQIVSNAIETEIDQLLKNDEWKDRTAAIATLIALNVVDVKIAVRPQSSGMYHEKLGIFKDTSNNAVSFKGSANETWNGWSSLGNFESIEVFCSWEKDGDAERVMRHIQYFDDLWCSKVPTIEVMDFPAAARAKLCRIAYDSIDEIQIPNAQTKPSAAKRRIPLEHQAAAIRNWKSHNHRGIFQHATGSGKTFTAITALKEHLLSHGTSLVLVPSKLLLRQWAKEIREEIPEAVLLKAGDGNDGWKRGRVLKDFTARDERLKPRVVLSTMQTASSDSFIQKLTAGDHLLIIGDEVHQTGSPENSKLYQINAGKRLGLSATPIRYGDPSGTAKMFDYFGPIVDPIITLQDAIIAGRLVQYEYYPYPVNLNLTEAEQWKNLSDQISREVAKSSSGSDGKLKISDRAKMMLIQRARIAKKANAKIALVQKILTEHYHDGEKWLVYCEDQEQLGLVLTSIRKLGLHVNEYHTSMASDMDSTLDWFKQHGGILVSIRCLDEGVDIPDVSHAIILASSQNPRQFIQRRGRVLRTAPDKFQATIHDAVVVPTDLENESEQTTLLRSELCRAIEFAEGGLNKSASAQLRRIAIDLGLDVQELANVGEEEEE